MCQAQKQQRALTQSIWITLCLACLLGNLATYSSAQEPLGPCEPRLADRSGASPHIRLAAAGETATVVLEWLGHSSFLLTSPEGLRLLTDPNGLHPPAVPPEVVTVSNRHVTHSGVGHVPGLPQVLWGITDKGWNGLALTIKDMQIYNVPSYASRTEPEKSPIQNSIFVIRTGGLCIAHLGNLRHPLTPEQLQRLGKPDVVMIPADGQWTLAYDDMMTVISQLQPLLVIPMHIESAIQAEPFVRYAGERYAVRRLAEPILLLSRPLLPPTTTIVVFSDT